MPRMTWSRRTHAMAGATGSDVTVAGRTFDVARRGLVELIVFGLLPATAYSLHWLGRRLAA